MEKKKERERKRNKEEIQVTYSNGFANLISDLISLDYWLFSVWIKLLLNNIITVMISSLKNVKFIN